VRGEQYVVHYEVLFERAARRVRCGMMIKSTTGLELGGGTWPPAARFDEEIAAGTLLRLQFTFRCQLFPGMYFLNVGLMGEIGGTETYLHRLVDALAFRVQPDASRRHSGYVDFDVEAQASLHGDHHPEH
jgi:lipopolysaccharide transport system ATP-binding protein